MSSDNVNILSYTSNIVAGGTITTEKVILGQYISLNIIPKADQDLTIQIQFSGDGTNFDYIVTKNITATSNTLESTPVVGKWLRLVITNNGGSDTTYLRVFVYGTPSNSSTLAQISKIGNSNPIIDIGNFPLSGFGSLKAEEETPKISMVFDRGTNDQLDNFKTPYERLKGIPESVGLSGYVTFADGLMKLSDDQTDLGKASTIQSGIIKYSAGTSISATFTGIFNQGTKDPTYPNAHRQLMGIGYADSTSAIIDFLGFGYYQYVSSPFVFSIIHIRNGVLISDTPQNLWNIDKCDGSYIMPAIDWAKINLFRIKLQYLGAGAITFEIENPNTGYFQYVHTIKYANNYTQTSLSSTSISWLMYYRVDTTGRDSVITSFMGTASVSLRHEGKINSNPSVFAVSNTKTGVTAETIILSIQNPATAFMGSLNRIPIEIDSLSASVRSTGSNTSLINVYFNPLLISPTFLPISGTLTPALYDTLASGFTGGRLIASYGLSSDDSIIVEYASNQHNAENGHYELEPGDIYTITCTSTGSTEVKVGLALNNL